MKKLILLVLATLTISGAASAFVPEMHFSVDTGEAAVTRIFNTTSQAIVCSGSALGTTYNGAVLNVDAKNLVINPNASVDIYVYSSYYDPMVKAWAEIECQTAKF